MIKNIKYYAGLLDSDGSITLAPYKTNDGFSLRFLVTFSQKTNNEWILEDLSKQINIPISRFERTDVRTGKLNRESKINITSSNAITFLQQIKQHLVIKNNLAEFAIKMHGRIVNEKELKVVRDVMKSLRDDLTPSIKNFPSRQWLAGYIDGDGYIGSSYNKDTGQLDFKFVLTTHKNDPQGILLIHRIFKGCFVTNNNTSRLMISLSKTKAEQFITYFNSHLKLKKPQFDFVLNVLREGKHLKRKGATLESNLEIHNTLQKLKKPQRLSEQTPAGEAIV